MAENIPERPRRDLAYAKGPPEPKPPPGLSKRARGIWQSITSDWVLGPEALPILRAGLEQMDLYDLALKQLKKDGLTVETGTGMLRAHPAAKIGQDALSSFRQCFRQLGLEPPEA